MKKSAWAFLIGALAMGVWPMHETWLSILVLWFTTDTYMHGLFVPVLAGMIMWQMPKCPNNEPVSPLFTMGVLVLWGGVATLSSYTLISTVAQWSAIATIPMFLVACYGPAWAWHYRTPLALWMMALPFGDFLIPHLQSITADMSVALLQWSGVSVVRNGWYIRIPAADFRVAEACSGVNFLISTFTLSVFYSFMYMNTIRKRLLFIAIGAIVPVLANGLRVYLIIMIAHWGNVEAATGFDHLVYGWVFFLFILGILLWIGRNMQDPVALTPGPVPAPLPRESHRLLWMGGVCATLVWLCSYSPLQPLRSSPAFNTWVSSIYPTADTVCVKPENGVQHAVFGYMEESVKSKLVSYENRVFDEQRWGLENVQSVHAMVDGLLVPVNQYSLVDLNGKKVQVLQSFRVAGSWHASTALLKWHQMLGKISGRDRGGEVHLWIIPSSLHEAGVPQLVSTCLQ